MDPTALGENRIYTLGPQNFSPLIPPLQVGGSFQELLVLLALIYKPAYLNV